MCQKTNADTFQSNLGSQSYVDLNLFKKKFVIFLWILNQSLTNKKGEFIPNLTIFNMLFFCGQKET